MSNRDSNGDADADAQLTPIHVTAVLVASVRAMSNALDALGFPEEDNRIVEQDGRFGFVTCSHEHDCDDMFALIAELSSSGETWEIQFQADLARRTGCSLTRSAGTSRSWPMSSTWCRILATGPAPKVQSYPSRTSIPARARMASSARCAG
jgi:hypothetical protein